MPALGFPLRPLLRDGKRRAGVLWGLHLNAPTPGAYLLCKPDPAGLGDPLPGMDARVNPDGRTVAAPSAELEEKSVEMIPPPQRAVRPRPEATCPLGISS